MVRSNYNECRKISIVRIQEMRGRGSQKNIQERHHQIQARTLCWHSLLLPTILFLPALFQEQTPFFHHAYKGKTNPLDVWGNNNWYEERPENIPKLQISVWHDSWYENPMIPDSSKIPDSWFKKPMISWYENPQFLVWKIFFPAKSLLQLLLTDPQNFVFSLITRIEHHRERR